MRGRQRGIASSRIALAAFVHAKATRARILQRQQKSPQIRPYDRCLRYEIDVRRFTTIAHAGATLVIGDATLLIDDEPIYEIQRAKVGTFRDIGYPDYPNQSVNSRGGKLQR